MKILLISHDLVVAGAPNSLLRQAKYLKNAGHDVEVYSLRAGGLEKRYTEAGFSVTFIQDNKRYIKRIYKEKCKKFDFILCNTTETYRCVDVLQRYETPLVWFIRETKLVEDNFEQNPDFASVLANFYNIYTVSNYTADVIRKYNKNVRVINNAVFDTFTKIKKTKDNINFGFIGSIRKAKGIDILVNAFIKLNEKYSDINLTIAGGNNLFDVDSAIENQKSIKYIGEVQGQEKKDFFANIDVLCVPSLDEPSGLIVIEGAMYGKVLIATQNTGANYLVKENKNGYIVETGSEKSLYNAMEKIIKNRNSLDEMKKYSRQQYLEYGTTEREEQEVLKMLEENLKNLPKVKNKLILEKQPSFLSQKLSLIKQKIRDNNVKIFGKIKKANGRRKFYLFGIKVLSYKRKAKAKSELTSQPLPNREPENVQKNDGLSYIMGLWEIYGATDKTISAMEYIIFHENSDNHLVYLIYLQSLLEKKDDKRCLIGLKYYQQKFGLQDIESFLPLSSFAHKNGFENERIKKAAFIFDAMEEEIKNKSFAKYIKDRTVAIVGNSPNILGKKQGKIIDDRDIVIRMNSFALNDELKEDIGSKINVWVHNAVSATSKCDNMNKIDDFDYIFLIDDYWHKCQIRTDGDIDLFLDKFYDVCKNKKAKLIYCPPEIKFDLKEKSGLRHPSAGLIILYYIYYLHGKLSSDSVFAFNEVEQPHGYDMPSKLKLPSKRDKDLFIEELDSFTFCLQSKMSHNFNEELRFRKTFVTEE